MGPDIAASTRVFVVVPRATDAAALFENDEVFAVVLFDEVDGGAHAWNWSQHIEIPDWLVSIGVDVPEMPAPIITTAALAWFLFPIGTSGQGMSPAMVYEYMYTQVKVPGSCRSYVYLVGIELQKYQEHGTTCVLFLIRKSNTIARMATGTTCLCIGRMGLRKRGTSRFPSAMSSVFRKSKP